MARVSTRLRPLCGSSGFHSGKDHDNDVEENPSLCGQGIGTLASALRWPSWWRASPQWPSTLPAGRSGNLVGHKVHQVNQAKGQQVQNVDDVAQASAKDDSVWKGARP